MTGIDRPKVLIVDDEKIIADTLAIILNNSGYNACAAYSGEMAISKATSFLPDMLISDVVMDGISGIEAAVKIRAMLPCCKVLLFSGQAATIDLLRKARAEGHAFEMLLKPVHPKDLLEKLRIGLLSELNRLGPTLQEPPMLTARTSIPSPAIYDHSARE